MQVLIGVDGSTGSFEAVTQAGQLLDPQRDQIAFYYSPPAVGIHPRGGADPAVVARAHQALAQAVLDEAANRLPAAWSGKTSAIVGTQKPDVCLLRAAEDTQADLIVVGAHGAGPLEKLWLGSVSQSIVRQAPVPVLVVRPRPADAPAGRRALWACDGSPHSAAAAAFLSRLCWPAGSSGLALSVIESLFAGEIPTWLAEKARDPDTEAMARAWAQSHEAEKQATLEGLQKLSAGLPECFRSQPPRVAEGHPAEQILQAAAETQADLIVVGARGLGAVARWVMGSTSQRVLSHAKCSVLVIHERPQP